MSSALPSSSVGDLPPADARATPSSQAGQIPRGACGHETGVLLLHRLGDIDERARKLEYHLGHLSSKLRIGRCLWLSLCLVSLWPAHFTRFLTWNLDQFSGVRPTAPAPRAGPTPPRNAGRSGERRPVHRQESSALITLLTSYPLTNGVAARLRRRTRTTQKTATPSTQMMPSYSMCMNHDFGAPQMEHLSGASPSTVLPHPRHTNIFVSGRSWPFPRVSIALE